MILNIEHIISIISNISSELIAAGLAFIVSTLYHRYIKTKEDTAQTAKLNARNKALLWARYTSILMIIVLIFVFFSLNKWFVVLISLCFSLLLMFFIYDYALSLFTGLAREKDSERRIQEIEKIAHQLSEISLNNPEDRERYFALQKRLKELMR